MKFWLNITARARDDITRNAGWWAENHSLDEALRWYDTIYEQLDTILEFPESHALSAENDEFPHELRDKLVGIGARKTYRAIFTMVDSEIRVLAVRRTSQDAFMQGDIH
jgi:plasmid stabilization system protein ParE